MLACFAWSTPGAPLRGCMCCGASVELARVTQWGEWGVVWSRAASHPPFREGHPPLRQGHASEQHTKLPVGAEAKKLFLCLPYQLPRSRRRLAAAVAQPARRQDQDTALATPCSKHHNTKMAIRLHQVVIACCCLQLVILQLVSWDA
jgi:hypothetical protein